MFPQNLLGFLLLPLLVVCPLRAQTIEARVQKNPTTYCNPLNLSYRYTIVAPGKREAADPVLQLYRGKYYLFASKSGGYWSTTDFARWSFVEIPLSVLPIEDYAPSTYVYDDWLYYVGSTRSEGMLYRTQNPDKGEWQPVKKIPANWDPAFLVEKDKLYIYYGCSATDPISVLSLDIKTLAVIDPVLPCLNRDLENHGFERGGDTNSGKKRIYLEGAWMNQHAGKYYLQYAVPGTQWKSYCDGLYVGDSPLGPFTFAPYSPISYKPTGFIGSAGHGAMAEIAPRDYWRVSTMAVCKDFMFERRIGLFPAGFDQEGFLFTQTYLGDYPTFLPQSGQTTAQPGWMLLSYKKPVTVSSQLDTFPAQNVTDEDVKTYWAAQTNTHGEWLSLDLEARCLINAIQVNFAEVGATFKGTRGDSRQNYRLWASANAQDWTLIVDKSAANEDAPHDYIEFESAFAARYIKIENVEFTSGTNFSLRDLRVFGKGSIPKPLPTKTLEVTRDKNDACVATLKWDEAKNARGYIVRYGIQADKLYNSIQIMECTNYSIRSLNKGQNYFFMVDSYNEAGVTPGTVVAPCE